MENNYKFNLNPKKLTSDDIAKHKDFAALLQRFEEAPQPAEAEPVVAKPVARRRWLRPVLALAAAAAVALLVFINVGKNVNGDYTKQEKAFFAEQPFINPPIEEIPGAQFASIKVDANEGGVYEYESGSKLVVPKAAFQDDKGRLIEGEVDIKYREYHDAIDFFLSGIPMTYDSAGVQYTLESAGMLEVYAEQNGQRVRMVPGKSIDVELVSFINTPNLNVPPKYNIYKLDQSNKKWVYEDVDNITILEDEFPELKTESPVFAVQNELKQSMAAIAQREETALAQLNGSIPKAAEPLKPQRSNGQNHVFNLDFEQEEGTNELYKGTLWQVSPNSPVTAAQLPREVEEVQGPTKLNERDYEVIFIAGNTRTRAIINPVLTGSDFDKALAEYTAKKAAYDEQMKTREAKLEAERAAIIARVAAERKAVRMKYDDAIASLQNANQNLAATDLMIRRKVVNRFTANEFGIWNCDRPLPPNVIQVNANFKTNTGKPLANQVAYLVDQSRNTVHRFLVTDGTELRYNTNSNNLLWVVTDDNKIAVFRPDDFKEMPVNTTEFTFELKEDKREIASEEDVREVLYF